MATERDAAAAVESFEDWEPVHLPAKNPSSSSSAAPNESQVADATSLVFPPPINHQILQIDQPSPTLFLPPPPPADGSGEEGGGSEIGDADSGERSCTDAAAGGGGNRRFEILKSGIARVAETVRRCAGGRSSGVWSCAVVAVAVLMYAKLVRWRRWVREETANHFNLLIRDKDEKIRQLMIQVARLNEMLIARRRVHVVRAPHYYRNTII